MRGFESEEFRGMTGGALAGFDGPSADQSIISPFARRIANDTLR